MVQDRIDRENQHIRGASISPGPLEEYERLRRFLGPRKKTPTPPSSKEYSDEELGTAYEASPWKENISAQQAELVNEYGLQGHHFRLTKVFRNTEESPYSGDHVGGGWSTLVDRYGFRYHKREAGVHPCKYKDRAQLRKNRFLPYMCSSYRLGTVREDPDDQFAGQDSYHSGSTVKSMTHIPSHFQISARETEEGRSLKKWEFTEVEKVLGFLHGVPEGSRPRR